MGRKKVTSPNINFIVTPCINNIQHFIVQLMHTKLNKTKTF